jgi:hypothetical protein
MNAASLRSDQAVAPGSVAALIGALPEGSFEVWVNGVAARRLERDRILIPPDAAAGEARLDLRLGDEVIARGRFEIGPAGPGLFGARQIGRETAVVEATGATAAICMFAGTEPARVLDVAAAEDGRQRITIELPANRTGEMPL